MACVLMQFDRFLMIVRHSVKLVNAHPNPEKGAERKQANKKQCMTLSNPLVRLAGNVGKL